jgi:ATP-binding cassette subfamily F protein 3
MATPEGASDVSLYTRHGELKAQLDEAVNDWETASMELEAAKG